MPLTIYVHADRDEWARHEDVAVDVDDAYPVNLDDMSEYHAMTVLARGVLRSGDKVSNAFVSHERFAELIGLAREWCREFTDAVVVTDDRERASDAIGNSRDRLVLI